MTIRDRKSTKVERRSVGSMTKMIWASLFLSLVMLAPVVPALHVPIAAAQVSSSCPPAGPVFLTTPYEWVGITNCDHSGPIFVNGSSTFTIANSSIIQSGPVSVVSGGLTITGSSITFQNSALDLLTAGTTQVIGSSILSSNVTQLEIGSYPLTPTPTSTTITSSNINATGVANTQLRIAGQSSVSIANSVLSDKVSAVQNALSNVFLLGGNISITNSYMVASGLGLYGYTTFSRSVLNASSSGSLSVTGSKIISGQVNNVGIYKSSVLSLLSALNMSIAGSVLQSVAQTSNVSLAVTSPQSLGYLTLNQSKVQTLGSPGFVNISATYTVNLDRADINASKSAFTFATYLLTAADSFITDNVVVGSTLGRGLFYNATTYGVSVIGNGQFTSYGWLLAHVVSQQGRQAVSGATVDVFDRSTGTSVYSSQTNSSGWAKLSVLLTQDMPPALPVEHPAYIVQASSGGLSSAQFLVTTNHTFFATLSVGAPFDPNAVITSSNSSYHVLTSRYSLWNYTFSTVPSSSILPTVPTITILSNAAVLNFQNNYSNTEFDYNVVGPGGSTFYFVVIYPKNLSTVAMSVRVNGTYVPTRLQSNSTHYFVIFLIPSGPYSIALTYANPSVSAGGNLPLFYPGIAVVGAIIALGVAGSVFLVVYVRRYERREELE